MLKNNTKTNIKICHINNFDTLQNARRDLIGEIHAIIDYDDHIHSTNDRLSRETWEDILQEELVHVGELLALLNYLDPTQMSHVENGIKEFNERLNKTNNL